MIAEEEMHQHGCIAMVSGNLNRLRARRQIDLGKELAVTAMNHAWKKFVCCSVDTLFALRMLSKGEACRCLI